MFTRDFTNTDKNIQKIAYYLMWKIILNENPLEFNLELLLK